MANYTIQEVSSTVGATTDISTIPLSGRTLYIIPKTGYVVDRNDFEEPTTLPSNVTSITFSNTSVGSEPGNQVKVVVGLSATTLTSNASIALGIVGDAKLYDQPVNDQGNSSLNYYVGLSEVSRSNSSAQLNSLSGSSVGVLSNQETVKPFSAPKKIGTINFTATAGNHFDTIPTVSKFGHTAYAPASVFTSNSKTIRDSDNFITSVVYDVYYISSQDTYKANQVNLKYESNAVSKSVVTNEVKIIDLGVKVVSNLGERKYIKVYGDVGAEFDISVIKHSDSSSLYAVNDIRIVSSDSLSTGVSSKLLINNEHKDNIYIDFPADSSGQTYNVYITPNNGTALGPAIPTPTSAPNYVFRQYSNPQLRLFLKRGSSSHQDTSFTLVGRVDKTASQLLHLFKPEQLNFVHTVNVTTSTVTSQPTWTTLTIENQPEHHVQTVFGEVKEGELNRIYFDTSSIYIPNVGVGGDSTILVEDGVDTTVPTRTITAKEPDYIQCSTNTFTVGKVKSFTMVKSCFDVGSVVKSLNGGTEINIRNISASLSGDSTAASVPFEVNINKFGNQDVQFDLKLDTFLTFNA